MPRRDAARPLNASVQTAERPAMPTAPQAHKESSAIMANDSTPIPVKEILGTEPEVLAAGVYAATLDRLEQMETAFGQRLAWRFVVPGAGADGAAFELTGWSGLKTHKSTKAGDWIEAITGRRLGKGEALRVEDLVGRSVQLVVKVDEASGFNRVEDVLPPARAAQAPAPTDPETEAAFLAFMAQRAASSGNEAA
jgi:hypothetical protein